jgi:hypothetical protein
MKPCDNVSACHDNELIVENQDGIRVICKECKCSYVIRKDPFTGAPNKRDYIKIFARYTLQGKDNLFYKYYPQHLRT